MLALPAFGRQLHEGATFNTPAPWGSRAGRERIVRHIGWAIDHTNRYTDGRQSTILISTFLLDRKRTVDALVRACRRGVSVRVLLDQDIMSRPSKRLIKTLNSDNVTDRNGDGKPDRPPRTGPCDTKKHHHHKHGHGKDKNGKNGKHGKGEHGHKVGHTSGHDKGKDVFTDVQAERSIRHTMRKPLTWGRDRSYVKKCQASCRGIRGNMHSKMYLFSRVRKVHDVVMVSSSNLNRGGMNLGWNDLWTMTNRPKSYRAYAHIHREMTNDRRAGRGLVEVRNGPYLSRFFPMKGAGRHRDPTLRDLDRVRCRGPLGHTSIHVSMFYWAGTRGNYIASKLLNLARAGCRVSIIYGAPSLKLAARLRAASGRHLIRLYDSRWDVNGDGTVDSRTHAKYMLIRGRYGHDKKAWLVFTGSQNWVAGSLRRSDETTLRIESREAYGQYLHNWRTIRHHSRRVPYHW